MVLRKDDEFDRRNLARGISVPALAVDGIPARINKTFGKSLRHMLKAAEVGIVTLAFFRQQGVQRMMKVVVPLRVEAVTAKFLWANQPGIVEGAFGNRINTP